MKLVRRRHVAFGAAILALSIASATAERSPHVTAAPTIRHAGPSEVAGPRDLTHEQRENLEARVATTLALVDRLAGDAKRGGLGRGWRQAAIESLLPLSLDALREVEARAVTLDALAHAAREVADDPGVLGDPHRDLVYRPIAPCRYIDTRSAAGKLSGLRGYDLAAGGATYGGTAACAPTSLFGVGDDQVAAVAMNVTIVDPATAPGFVAVKPTAASPTVSLLNWYDTGPSVQVANQGIVSTLQDNASGDEFVIQSSAPVHVIVDLFGAFVAGPAHAFVSATGGGPNPTATLQFLGVPVSVTITNPAQRVLVTAFNGFGTGGSPAASLNLFVCSQALPGPATVQKFGDGIVGLQHPANTRLIHGLTQVLQLPNGSYKVGMCGTGGSGWNNNDWGMTSAFVF